MGDIFPALKMRKRRGEIWPIKTRGGVLGASRSSGCGERSGMVLEGGAAE